ncbi:hypothetical protein K439DRAFT_1642742 [Ramaria rubella]|nr:hypothetical protein K439DRAFT_1642742 [Ramaria rubella]
MPASSPMSRFAAHGLVPQARRNGLRCRRSTPPRYPSCDKRSEASKRSLRRPCDTDGMPVQSTSSHYLPQHHLLRLD